MVTGKSGRGYDALIAAPFGAIAVSVENGHVSAVRILPDGPGPAPPAAPAGAAARAAREIARYLADGSYRMRIPVAADGTDYQRRVWQALTRIPAGQTTTYGELARRIGGSARSVAMACRDNPIALVVPCHRVLARNGLGGYMGATAGRRLEIKRWLLEHEREPTGAR